MVLEATMIIVDNSEPSRNGDYPPTRFAAQSDAVNLLFHSKTQSNPESSVGLLSMASPTGSGPEVLTTLTTNPGKILDGLHRTKIGGHGSLYTAIMVAGLALKHRGNKSQRQRVVCFVCSPIQDERQALVKLGKRMKKNNTSVDIVAFGDLTDENISKLQAFNEAVKGGDGSHLEIVPPGPNLLSDSIVASPILAGEGGAPATNGGGAGAAGDENFEFGIDPSVDPELALALRMSLEEDRQRQERERKAQEEREGKSQLESVPEGSEGQPLLDGNGEPAGSAADPSASNTDTAVRREEDGKREGGDGHEDKMDTA